MTVLKISEPDSLGVQATSWEVVNTFKSDTNSRHQVNCLGALARTQWIARVYSASQGMWPSPCVAPVLCESLDLHSSTSISVFQAQALLQGSTHIFLIILGIWPHLCL